MIYYLDASCMLRRLIGDGQALETWGEWDQAFSSEIGLIEVHRTLARLHSDRRITSQEFESTSSAFDAMAASLAWAPISSPVVRIAMGKLPTVVKALDAVHLATAIEAREAGATGIIFGTHDRQLGAAATASGFEVDGL